MYIDSNKLTLLAYVGVCGMITRRVFSSVSLLISLPVPALSWMQEFTLTDGLSVLVRPFDAQW